MNPIERRKVKKVLKEAREIIGRGWTTNTCARNKKGIPCSSTSPEATQWCAEGAIIKAAAGDEILKHHAWTAFSCAVLDTRFMTGNKWNDKQIGAKPVMAALRRAARMVQ
jgi:hypothetical protein